MKMRTESKIRRITKPIITYSRLIFIVASGLLGSLRTVIAESPADRSVLRSAIGIETANAETPNTTQLSTLSLVSSIFAPLRFALHSVPPSLRGDSDHSALRWRLARFLGGSASSSLSASPPLARLHDHRCRRDAGHSMDSEGGRRAEGMCSASLAAPVSATQRLVLAAMGRSASTAFIEYVLTFGPKESVSRPLGLGSWRLTFPLASVSALRPPAGSPQS